MHGWNCRWRVLIAEEEMEESERSRTISEQEERKLA